MAQADQGADSAGVLPNRLPAKCGSSHGGNRSPDHKRVKFAPAGLLCCRAKPTISAALIFRPIDLWCRDFLAFADIYLQNLDTSGRVRPVKKLQTQGKHEWQLVP
jgi:hypothetical protein